MLRGPDLLQGGTSKAAAWRPACPSGGRARVAPHGAPRRAGCMDLWIPRPVGARRNGIPGSMRPQGAQGRLAPSPHTSLCSVRGYFRSIPPGCEPLRNVTFYSVFGIGVDRRNALKCFFHQEKGTLKSTQKVYMYSENALAQRTSTARRATRPSSFRCGPSP
jgi:hypothetical protein